MDDLVEQRLGKNGRGFLALFKAGVLEIFYLLQKTVLAELLDLSLGERLLGRRKDPGLHRLALPLLRVPLLLPFSFAVALALRQGAPRDHLFVRHLSLGTVPLRRRGTAL